MTLLKIREHVLLFAEAFDAWRVIPRLMILSYGYLVFNLYLWYKNIPTYVQEKCDATILSQMLEAGKGMAEIKQYACTVVDVVGGPTVAQSTFVTTIIGLSTGIFGLYTATGRKWENWTPTGPAVVQYGPTSVTTPDGEVLPVRNPNRGDRDRNGGGGKPTIQIYTADEGKTPEPRGLGNSPADGEGEEWRDDGPRP